MEEGRRKKEKKKEEEEDEEKGRGGKRPHCIFIRYRIRICALLMVHLSIDENSRHMIHSDDDDDDFCEKGFFIECLDGRRDVPYAYQYNR